MNKFFCRIPRKYLIIIVTEDINNISTIISAINLTDEELNNEKERMIESANKDRNGKSS